MAGYNGKFVFVCLLFIVFIFPGATSVVASDQKGEEKVQLYSTGNLI